MMKGKKNVECYRMIVLQRLYSLGTVTTEKPVSTQQKLK